MLQAWGRQIEREGGNGWISSDGKPHKGDLSVYTPFTKEDKERVLWVSIEDKRLEVFRAHHAEFCSYGDYDLFPWATNADDFEKALSPLPQAYLVLV
jgi:hypothetical protein